MKPQGLAQPVRAIAVVAVTLLGLLAALGMSPGAQALPPENPNQQGPIQANLGPDAQPVPKNLNYAWSFVLADANSGEILAMKDPDRELAQASTLKVLTALTTMPHLDPHSTYYGTKQDAEAEGMRAGINAGDSYSVDDLFHGMLMPSGNDAASAVANANGGWKQTIEAMNTEAKRVGANHTVAKTPSGLDEPGQHSSARDLVTIFRNAMQIPEFGQVMSVKRYEFPSPSAGSSQSSNSNSKSVSSDGFSEDSDESSTSNTTSNTTSNSSSDSGNSTRGTYPIWTSNRLLLNDHPGALGGKTGFTSQAGRTFVAATERNGRTLILSLMRSARSTELVSEQLLDWGFANADKVTPVGSLPELAPRLPSQALPAVQLNPDGSPKPDQQTAIDNLATANEGKTMNSVAQATGTAMGSSLLSNLFRPVLWLAALALLAVAVLRLRVMVLEARRGPGPNEGPSNIDLRQSERERSNF